MLSRIASRSLLTPSSVSTWISTVSEPRSGATVRRIVLQMRPGGQLSGEAPHGEANSVSNIERASESDLSELPASWTVRAAACSACAVVARATAAIASAATTSRSANPALPDRSVVLLAVRPPALRARPGLGSANDATLIHHNP